LAPDGVRAGSEGSAAHTPLPPTPSALEVLGADRAICENGERFVEKAAKISMAALPTPT
jgi:hypothetical protein